MPLRVHGRTCREEWPPAATARACSGTSPPPPICCSSPCAYLAEGQRAGGTRAKPSSPRPPATWPSARPSSTGRARAPPPPPRQRGSGPSTTKRGGRGCCCLCVSSAGWMAGRAVSPNRFAVWGLPPTRATKASGSGLTKSGDPLAAGAGDSGGVAARLLCHTPAVARHRDGVGGLRGATAVRSRQTGDQLVAQTGHGRCEIPGAGRRSPRALGPG